MKTLVGTDVQIAARILERGGLVAIPTETVYGLAGNALNEPAVTEIFKVKSRPSFDPLIVHVSGADQVDKYAAEIPGIAFRLMENFWPGPLTLLLKKKSVIPDLVTSGSDLVALRHPAHPMTGTLLSMVDFPLAAPSANPFGYVSPTTAQHVMDQLSGLIPYILDGGECRVGIESTIVGFDGDACLVYREGGVSRESIVRVAGAVLLEAPTGKTKDAPGMLESHYAPRKPLFFGLPGNLFREHPAQGSAYVCLSASGTDLPPGIDLFELSPSGNLDEAARNLFAVIRRLDQSGCARILASPFPDHGLGRAINDRLRRAAAKRIEQ
jgi:L-threonylcarbamoyladenylate synthase